MAANTGMPVCAVAAAAYGRHVPPLLGQLAHVTGSPLAAPGVARAVAHGFRVGGGGRERRRRSCFDRRRAGAPARQGRQGAGRQHGYRRYLKTISDQHFAIDPDKIAEDNKFDGIFVLRTNTDLNPLAAMLCYKQLWTVEQTFRTAKHLLSTRPIFHKLDETIRGHVFCSFLALVLKKALEDRITALDSSGSWPETIADLDSLTKTEIEYDGKRFHRPLPTAARCQPRPACSRGRAAANRARRYGLLDFAPIENVVPSRRCGVDCRCRSAT